MSTTYMHTAIEQALGYVEAPAFTPSALAAAGTPLSPIRSEILKQASAAVGATEGDASDRRFAALFGPSGAHLKDEESPLEAARRLAGTKGRTDTTCISFQCVIWGRAVAAVERAKLGSGRKIVTAGNAESLPGWTAASPRMPATRRPAPGDIFKLATFKRETGPYGDEIVSKDKFSHIAFLESIEVLGPDKEVWTSIDGGQGTSTSYTASGQLINAHGTEKILRRRRIYTPSTNMIVGEPPPGSPASRQPVSQDNMTRLVNGWVDVDAQMTPAKAGATPPAKSGAPASGAPGTKPAAAPVTGPPPSSELRWDGATDAQVQFMRKVYEAHIARARGGKARFVADLAPGERADIEGGKSARTATAQSCVRLLAAARAKLASEKAAGVAAAKACASIGVASGYRPMTQQFALWQRYFPGWYAKTSERRRALGDGEHGRAAVDLMVTHIGGLFAAPGYSNHQHGLAIDFMTTDHGVALGPSSSQRKPWRASWFYSWLQANKMQFGCQENPNIDEPWHWEFTSASGAGAVAQGTDDERDARALAVVMAAMRAGNGAAGASAFATSPAKAALERRSGMWGLDLDEKGLGADLAALLPADPKLVVDVFKLLSFNDTDDVAYAIHVAVPDDAELARKLRPYPHVARLLVTCLQSGSTDDNEAKAIERFTRAGSAAHDRLAREPWAGTPAFKAALASAGARIQSNRDGHGDLIQDQYTIDVASMPLGLTPEALLQQLVVDINGTVKSSTFDGINTFHRRPKVGNSGGPAVGDIYHIDMAGPDNGSVMLVELTPDHFVFQTVWTKEDGDHPENGARQFGFERLSTGVIQWYTKGTSRPVLMPLAGSVGRHAQESGWTAFVTGVGTVVEARGGKLKPNPLAAWQTHRDDVTSSGRWTL